MAGGIKQKQNFFIAMGLVAKGIFFAILSISFLVVVALLLLSLDHWTHPFKKNSEAVILLIGGFIISAGMVLSIKYGYFAGSMSTGVLLLAGSWLVTLFCITLGLMFFNGPTKS